MSPYQLGQVLGVLLAPVGLYFFYMWLTTPLEQGWPFAIRKRGEPSR